MQFKERKQKLKERKWKKNTYALLCVLIFISMTVIPFYLWITSGMMNIGITSIRGNSMEPTFSNGQILYVQPAQYERGEIVVVYCADTGDYNIDGVSLLKRIVGLPGETVEIIEEGILIDGELLDESTYIDTQKESLQDDNDVEEIVLSDNEYFILGDNRGDSFDSRHIGAVHSKDFLYGLTTEPNDYTMIILRNVIIIATINLFIIVTSPIVLLFALTYEKTTKEKSIKKTRVKTVRKGKKNQITSTPKRARKYLRKKKTKK